MELIIVAYEKMVKGFIFNNPANNVHFYQYVTGYVDINTLLLTFRDNERAEEMLQEAQEAMTIWQKVLQITGGDLELRKCFFILDENWRKETKQL